MLPHKEKTVNSQPPTDDKNHQVTTSESEEELQKKATEEYQKLGPDRDDSVDIIHKP
ncbi:MAG TPA: hypothetical protein VK211_03560 [Kamptonema sp.]|nr:hypothetical protein [Kamptonema sp.]